MNHNTPISPRPLSDLSDVRRRVLSGAQLRARGVTAEQAAERCGPGGPWQQILPGVFLLHPGTPTSEERLHAAVAYAGRPGAGEAMVTGPAALALHRFASAPSLTALERIDVLVPHTRRLRSVGCARLIRTQALPAPDVVTGLPVAPVERALADTVARLGEPAAVRRLLTEAVSGGHCEPGSVVAELTRARLLSRPHVVSAVDSLLAEGRAVAEGRLYDLVRMYGVPDPVWNVVLRLPGGPRLGGVDAYWPDEAVAVELGTRAARAASAHDGPGADPRRSASGRRGELERLGITVVRIAPRDLRDAPVQQAMVLRAALTACRDREPAPYVVVLPR
ncbi:hypothetical protein [Streptomyces pacificus]|uniref:DUF559 domain-containing protein n=1 Tax=Streptomyces pacificus TaxID=2705029 RepID=A0A6A0ANA0_9ACTN|nr:hypothetical protein [Streptomyces pacificus]GFH34078.1 hypothetical protein SCWH03_02840 [Streptomyces pacificus]